MKSFSEEILTFFVDDLVSMDSPDNCISAVVCVVGAESCVWAIIVKDERSQLILMRSFYSNPFQIRGSLLFSCCLSLNIDGVFLD